MTLNFFQTLSVSLGIFHFYFCLYQPPFRCERFPEIQSEYKDKGANDNAAVILKNVKRICAGT